MNRIRALTVVTLLSTASCGSSSSPEGGPITGQPADTHCDGVAPQAVGLCTCDIPTTSDTGATVNVSRTESLMMCIADSNASAGLSTAVNPPLERKRAALVAADDDTGGTDDFGATLNGSMGDDDDCKYSVSWTSTPIRENTDVTFTVTAKELASTPALAPMTGGDVILEAFLTDLHPADTSQANSTETAAGSGTYRVGPVRFDAAGIWTVRFHFNELCSDTEDSPHGHAAFFVQVP